MRKYVAIGQVAGGPEQVAGSGNVLGLRWATDYMSSTIYSWDMQRNQTCKIVDIYHFPSLPQLEKNKACCMMLNKSISEKIWILSWGIELQTAKYTVSIDAIQEHYYTGTKIVGSFYNIITLPRSKILTVFRMPPTESSQKHGPLRWARIGFCSLFLGVLLYYFQKISD